MPSQIADLRELHNAKLDVLSDIAGSVSCDSWNVVRVERFTQTIQNSGREGDHSHKPPCPAFDGSKVEGHKALV